MVGAFDDSKFGAGDFFMDDFGGRVWVERVFVTDDNQSRDFDFGKIF